MIQRELTSAERGVSDEEEAREMGGSGMPRGLMLAVARDMHAMETYAKMSEAERAAFLEKARQTPAGEPMQRLVRDMQRGGMNL